MPESIEKTHELLLQAKKETAQAAKELDEVQAKKAVAEEVSLDVNLSFPKTDGVLNEIESNVARIREAKEKMAKLVGDVALIRESLGQIELLGRFCEEYIKEIQHLDSVGQYKAALQRCDRLEAQAKGADFGHELALQRNALEIAAWTRCTIYIHMAEANIREGLAPMDDDSLERLSKCVEELPLEIHPEDQKKRYLERIHSYRLICKAKWAVASGNSYEVLTSCLDLVKETKEKERGLSDLTKNRLAYLLGVCCDIFNYLSTDAFDVRRNYPDAERLFLLRDAFEPSTIVHSAYRESEDVKEFHIRFLLAEARLMDDEAFSIAACAYADSVRKHDEFEMDLLLAMLTMDGLTDSKKDALIAALNRLSFELEIYVLGTALQKGIDVGTQDKILHGILRHKKRELHLEFSAKPLLNCKKLLDESLQKIFGELLSDILRSPRAHKVCVKSNSVELHALYGETEETMRRPWGKPMESDLVKAWPASTKFCYIFFGLIFTLGLMATVFSVLLGMFTYNPILSYLVLAPMMVSLVILHFAICRRFGRDERGSAVFRRVLAIDALLKSIASVLYFAMPQMFAVLAPVRYTLIIFAAIEGLWALFIYKDKKRAPAIITFVPLLLCEVASLVLLILALMNGTI